MNNEPVAYLMVERNDGNSYIQMGVPTRDEKISHQPCPLCTHPAKTLTDDEITAISQEIFKDYKNYHHYQIDFARAVIKEAQEK